MGNIASKKGAIMGLLSLYLGRAFHCILNEQMVKDTLSSFNRDCAFAPAGLMDVMEVS